jgi:hypothetical protein
MRPVVFDIARQIMKATGIGESVRIQFNGGEEVSMQRGTSITPPADGELNSFPYTDKVTIEVDETYQEDRILSTAVHRPEQLFVFRDDRVNTSIKPGYSTTEVTLNFKYRARDPQAAKRWRDGMKNKVSMNLSERLHQVTYHWLIPPEYIRILEEIHALRETKAPYGQTFDQWFKENASQRVSELTNLNGSAKSWGVSETQMRIVGFFDFNGQPEQGSKEDEGDTWTISVGYKFQFDKPIIAIMSYPIMIHNSLLSKAFRPSETVDIQQNHKRSYAMSAAEFKGFEKGHEFVGMTSQSGVAIPAFDDFIPGSVVDDSVRIFTALVAIDETNPTALLKLDALGGGGAGWFIDADIVNYMKSESQYLTTPGMNPFIVSLYHNELLLGRDNVTVDPDLSVRATGDLSMRACYHVRLGLLRDLSRLPRAVLDRLREHGPALVKILDGIDPSLGKRGLLPDFLGDSTYVTRAALDRCIAEINRATLSQGNGEVYQFNTVMNLLVKAIRKN